MSENSEAVAGPVERPVRPLGEPLFLLHCGALFGGERDDWDVEANSGRAVDELADRHPGETLHLYALTAEEVAAVNKLRARKVWQTRQTHLCKCDHNEYCRPARRKGQTMTEKLPSTDGAARRDGSRLSEGLGMSVGMRYVVTHASEGGEFEVGDRVRLLADGSIENVQAEGWMPAEDVPEATRGMRVAPDAAWAAAMRADLERALADLKGWC